LKESIEIRFLDVVTTIMKDSTLVPYVEKVLQELVVAAGFGPVQITQGKLRGDYKDQDGSKTGQTYPINHYPFKVITEEGEDYYAATGWLDNAIYYAKNLLSGHAEEAAKKMHEIIKNSIPLEPIILSKIGDELVEYPSSDYYFGYEYFLKHTRNKDMLSTSVGIHETCRSWMDKKRITKTHDAIICRGCHARFPFPKRIQTYGELRQYFRIEVG